MDVKTLFVRTYGKQKRQLTAWISPGRHKRAFDSSRSTDSDVSEFEPPKPTKTRMKSVAANHRVARPARKKKAPLQLTNSFDEKNSSREPNAENVILSPSPYSTTAQQNKTKRRKKTSVKDRAVRPAKKTKSSDEENVCKPSPTDHQQVQQSKTARRRNNLVLEPGVPIKHKPDQVPAGSYSEIDWTSAPQSHTASVTMKRRSNVPSVGHFLTRRRCGTSTKHQPPKGKISVLNSSDDFSSGAFSASRNLRPFRRARVPSTFILSSAENSVNVAGASCVPTSPLQEISLNESSDPSIRPCSRKPIFCSTPTAGSLRKHPRLKPFPITDLSSMPLSISVNCIDSLSTLQNDVDSPGPVASQRSVPPTVVSSHEMQHLDLSKKERALHQHNEPSGDFFMESKTTDTSEDNKKPSEDPQTRSGEELCLNLLLSNNESSSNFVNTSGALEWLVQTLKEKCLTEQCTVLLERLDIASLTQLSSQTTYSSCLGDEYFVKSLQNNEHPVSVDSGQTVDLQQSSVESFNTFLSVTDHRNGKSLLPVNSFDYSEQAPSLNDSQSSNLSPSVDSKQSAECSSTSEFIRPSASVVSDESVYYINSSAEVTMNTEESTSNTVQTEDVEAIKDKCCIKKCTVHLKNLSLSQLIYEQLKGFEQQNESHLTFNGGAADPNSETENDHTHDINPPKDLVYVGAIQSNNPEMKKIPMSTRALKVNTLSNKLTVNVQRITLSELRDTLNPTGRKPNSPTAVPDPDSDNQSLSDTNHCNEVSSLQRLTHSNDKISTNTEGTLPTRRKMSVARKERKRRSTSRDRPGTTRKACVSGLSVNRWRTQSSTSSHVFRGQRAPGHVKALDCSLDELISAQHKQQQLLGPAMKFSTPVRASELNLSSVLADMTPRSYTWSRLKAALSVHRKGLVLLTPRTVAASGSPGGADLSRDLFASPFRTPLPKHLKSQLRRNDSLVVCEDLSDAEKVYAECGQPRALPWEECILPHRMKQCVKIGEGTFGEVFSTTNASGDTVALKIIPVEGSEKVNGEDQKTFGEILHEIIISKELSSLKEKRHNQTHSFIGLNDLHCVQGCYPPDFLDAWDRFDQQKGSENDRPDFFQRDQIFLILEFEFGGIDLENSNGTLASLGVARSILHQVTASLAVAEQQLHFEHRDLHWGNILVKTTKQKTGSFLLNGMTHSLETKGVLVRIIDYSLSRLEIDELTVSCDISKDEELFMGQGDYQFEIYRLMRKENGNNWSDYQPHTNVLWLHYLCSKLLSMKYRGTGGRGAKQIREELTRFYDGVLRYSSATEVLQHSPMFQ